MNTMAKKGVKKRSKVRRKLQFGVKKNSKRKIQSGGGKRRTRKRRMVRRRKQQSMRGGGAQVKEGRELGVGGLNLNPGGVQGLARDGEESKKRGERPETFMMKVLGQTFLNILNQD